jgi:hypothetical protein
MRRPRDRSITDWHAEAPHEPEARIIWLRAEASALLSEARDIETHQPFPPEHSCETCEDCRLKIMAEGRRYG